MHCIRSRCHPLLFNAPPPPPPQVFWTLFGAVLVFFMQIGFSMLEVGSVQAKSTKNVLVKNSFDVCLSSLCWAVVGHSIAFGHSEGTYLRRQIMVAYGALDFVFAYLAYDYWPPAQKSVVAGFALMHCVEGSVFLGDALLRPRPVKIGKGRNFGKAS